MFQEKWSDFVEQIEDVTFYLLIVDKFAFVCATESGKPEDAIVIIKEVFSEKHTGGIAIYTILKHFEFFKNSNRIAGIRTIFQAP